MHISEGVLSFPVLISGDLIAVAGTYLGIRKLEEKNIPEVAILSAGFFIASLIHVPIGPSSVHLILNGLIGVLLGWASFPAILLALFLQAILFQFGGLTTLGINTVNMGVPAVICWYFFGKSARKQGIISDISSFTAGFFGVFFGAVFVALSLVSTGEVFINISKVVIVAHLPIMIIEGFITLFILKFLKKAKPDILEIRGR